MSNNDTELYTEEEEEEDFHDIRIHARVVYGRRHEGNP